ncbi:MAG: DUF4214 domain-containing protein [Planctomycetia bacterium]|nr:DUF4214 domain-containing protein [Planctomycetia bacterium]
MGERTRRRRRAKVGVEQLERRAMLATVSGSVQRSVDAVGLDPNDPLFAGIPGVTVQLRDPAGTLLAQQVTGSSGNYSFPGVTTGRREVSVVLPAGFLGTSAQSLSYDLTVGATDVTGLTFALASRNQAIAQNLYELVLQRPPTADELAASVSRLNGGPVAEEFGRLLQSAEFGSVIRPVAGFTDAMFPGVLPIEIVRASGQQQRLGVTPAATFQGIMSSQPFVATHGDTSRLANGDYVRFLYRQLLGRSPAPGPFRSAVNQLAAGTSRGQLALNLVNTSAFQGRGNLTKQYRGAITYAAMLGREANPGEIRAFAAGDGNAVQLARQLSRSATFRNLTGYTSTATWDVMAMASSLSPSVSPLSRLQRYNPTTQAFDLPVAAGSLASTAAAPKNVYFISHGWAPGKTEAVLLGSDPGDPLKSWAPSQLVPPWLFDPTAQVASTGMAQTIIDADPAAIVIAYSWLDLSATPTASEKVNLTLTGSTVQPPPPAAADLHVIDVGDTSMLGVGLEVTGAGIPAGTTVARILGPTQVRLSQPTSAAITAVPLTFSGYDLETTIKSLLYVGQSESRTQWAGLMLAEAIKQALAPSFFGTNKGLVHLMGHSHGAKVATVATVALEAADVPVSQLTLFESPETGPTRPIDLDIPGIGGGQNFVWRFLQELPPGRISKTPVAIGREATGGTFVDSYYSATGFGAPLNGYAGLGSVVDVLLRPAELYNPSGSIAGDLNALFPSHDYPPAWYAQASLQNPSAASNVKNGLYWSPLLNPATTALLQPTHEQFQPFPSPNPGEFVRRQFEVAGSGASPAVTVSSSPLAYAAQPTMGNVVDDGSEMIFTIGGANPLSTATISFVPFATNPTDRPTGTGLELDVAFAGIDPGETVQLVVSVHGMAVPQVNLPPTLLSGSTGFMTIPLLTLDGGASGAGPRMATISLDVFRNQTIINGAFASAANPVPQLVFSLIGSAGATASATVTNMRQFGTPS